MRILMLAACLASAPALAQAPRPEEPHVAVSGQAEVTGTPDVLRADLGVTVTSRTAEEALDAAAARTQRIIVALRREGVREEDIQTSQLTAHPEFDPEARRPKVVGYRVTSTLIAKVRDLDEAGEVLDAAMEAGGDDLVVQGLSFDLEDDDELVRQAREQAWADAERKANQLADLAGVQLGRPIAIRETFAPPPQPIPMAREATQADMAMPIEPGQIGVTVILEVDFAIDRPRG
jgi:uncharacterized protein YggE